ncbi:MAG: hypothetical protein KatS3mg109_1021 [Pirellulaceae bacterium]|nr:MAG: hypothetical protein KatS3mg109_1021 [Pirellulaceae bacterium]
MTQPSCDMAREDMSVEEMMHLIETTPPGPWPAGWAGWANVNEAHRRMARQFADSLKPGRHVYPEKRGIVIAGGGLKYFPGVWVCVNLIRHFGCELPIQLWYLGDGECDPYMKRLLKPFGVECVDARKLEKEYPCRILCGWELKPYSALYSPFEQVLFLDADNGPVRDVTYLFDTPHFQQYGAIFWPDYACWTLKPEVWQIFGMDWMVERAADEVAFESGQYLIDKTRCWRELRMALWYAEHSDFVFRVVYGDKECFHLAWRFLGTRYAMPPHPPGWNVHTIVQYDFAGQIVFQHRCQDKWRFAGNRRNDSLANEDLCFSFIAALRTKWTGVLWQNPDPTLAEARVITSLVGKRFLYRRVGYDERPIRLEAGGQITEGAAECERRWDVNIDDGQLVLTISRLDRPTCHLRPKPDATWEGRWLEFEQMPVELIPLES